MTRGGTVYILASQPNGTLYIGVTSDLVRRVGQHRNGTTGGFASEHGVTRLVHFERYDDIRDAFDRETRLKKWNRAWKLRLIRENNPDEQDLFDDVASRPGIPLAMSSEPMDWLRRPRRLGSRLRGNDGGGGGSEMKRMMVAVLVAFALAAPAMGQGSSVALARWTLVSVPPYAVLVAQNDADTSALRTLQANGLRSDVQIVRADDPSTAALVAAWATAPRPVVGTLTLDPEVFGRAAPAVVSAGAYQRPARANEPPFDLATAEASAGSVRGADFAGPPEGIAPLGGVVLFQLLQTAVSHAQTGDAASAERAYTRAQTFAADAGLADDPLVGIAREWIDDALAARSASNRTAGPSTPSAP